MILSRMPDSCWWNPVFLCLQVVQKALFVDTSPLSADSWRPNDDIWPVNADILGPSADTLSPSTVSIILGGRAGYE